ncbi:tagaturonate epimerase family protein [Georgenia sp. H159]|uniref:tagaturonate epimerase family protein n=1 Tax=Georgenia sp. H159 TaxID=3076115 RepID=UPI002D79F326|nr:tagaturonate epimerase family protein [Georgenia sp. H159]
MTLRNDTYEARVVRAGTDRLLRVSAPEPAALDAFTGTSGQGEGRYVLEGPLSAANAAALRVAFPHLRPALIGRERTSVGTGDRLGLATPGHVRAFQQSGGGVVPVFAQQSIREMDRLGRDAQSVMDDATFGCVQAGWSGDVGADCDHIKTTDGIDRGLAAGFTMFTLDPGDHVVDVRGGIDDARVAAVPWGLLEDDVAGLRARYVGTTLDVGDRHVTIGEEEILTAAVKYGACVAEARRLHDHLMDRATYPVEVEIAVDETDFVTSFVEHYYLAAELRRLGVGWVSFAPRYADGFEKGVEYLGEPESLRANLLGHTAVAEALGGYKISLHSGSDKFSIYPLAVEATGGRIHLKTSGTSYLCALEVVARQDGDVLAEIWSVSRQAFVRARASYQVSADVTRTPETLEGVDLVELVSAFDSRQILHVGYGDVLNTTGADGRPLRARLHELLVAHDDAYATVVAEHLARHVAPFAAAVTSRA